MNQPTAGTTLLPKKEWDTGRGSGKKASLQIAKKTKSRISSLYWGKKARGEGSGGAFVLPAFVLEGDPILGATEEKPTGSSGAGEKDKNRNFCLPRKGKVSRTQWSGSVIGPWLACWGEASKK